MNVQVIIQYATLASVLIGSLGLAVAFLIHREQVKTQIFLALSARYDELLHSSSAGVWLSAPTEGMVIAERSQEVTISALRFCTLVSLAYFLFLDRRIPKRMWHLMLRSAERRMRSPWFVREWEHLRSEFESFPEFVNLVTSVQSGTYK
ncbi:MAG: hypothetical protein JO210_00170 [Acidobacteriaceae bacterium]|nr:hypothetical protein [Acidobacteriaceae bacterium]